ncbi:MAG: hypothetical protein LBM04_10675 [Opitutaceae bacterium]|jgi:hypothetical protein|nr:hypothetical protein [Opitutaceae bacterium]
MNASNSNGRYYHLPVVYRDGKLSAADGRKLPPLKDSTWGELVIPLDSLTGTEAGRRYLSGDERALYIPQKCLWAFVSTRKTPEHLIKFVEQKNTRNGVFLFVRFVLKKELKLAGSGRTARLMECDCEIPALQKKAAKSVNEAYTRISEAFEPARRSHTGNVFDKVFFESANNVLFPLRELRNGKNS